jgi:urea transporter
MWITGFTAMLAARTLGETFIPLTSYVMFFEFRSLLGVCVLTQKCRDEMLLPKGLKPCSEPFTI